MDPTQTPGAEATPEAEAAAAAAAPVAEEPLETTRFNWNVIPAGAVEAKKHLVLPLGAVHTPLMAGAVRVPYGPLMCQGPCRTVLNPYCGLSLEQKFWVCPFCMTRNAFPPQYAQISATNLPAELFPKYSTIEYTLPLPKGSAPAFLFVVDTCLPEAEFAALKDALIEALGLIPPDAYVGLITCGATVQVYQLSFALCPKAYVFSGNREYTGKRVGELLGLPQRPQQAPGTAAAGGAALPVVKNGFLVPLSECEFTLTSLLDELQRDPWPVSSGMRAKQSYGTALSVAVGLLERVCPGGAARVVGFVGSPCTHGPGAVVGEDLKESLRCHSDIAKGSAPHCSAATKYYSALAQRAAAANICVDLLCCAIDQVGLWEMQSLCRRTGGLNIMTDSFAKDTFSKTFLGLFERSPANPDELAIGFNATIEVQTCRDLKVAGCVGHVFSLERKTAAVSENEVGVGGTSAWRACAVSPRTSFGFYFDVAGTGAVVGAAGQPAPALVQFLTCYQSSTGEHLLRVTTVARAWTNPSAQGTADLARSFDQETAAVLLARQAVTKLDNEDPYDVLRWVDRTLIRLVSKFADYRKDDPASLTLGEQFVLFPQFMYHLRRSHFLRVFNCSPDETVFYRSTLLRENTTNSIIMIQPMLESYEISDPNPRSVLLSASSVDSSKILVLDTFFLVLVFLGHDVFEARKEGLAEKPEGEAFRNFLAAPLADAQALCKDRLPYPRYIECAQFSGDARHLLAIIDPNVTHNTASKSGVGEAVLTEDVSLQVFVDHLKRAAVQQQ